ncbi:protein late bloomer [Drosophila sulfurigaster albostrigata]|uniref:protein late bloomer n=1 Tax=Drosophila sulfurigaster albostrigata TaxID=89887 RepID=UPI002D21C32A|nr:protein late bloomer [Drosophila sulfurigaster albostrigata]
MGCATTAVKIISIALNVILALLALGSIGWIAFNSDTGTDETIIASYVASVLIVLLAFTGIYAAIRESVCLTATVAVLLLVLAILQILTTCLFLHPMKVESAQKQIDVAWQTHNMDGNQQIYECCGKSSAQDYVHLNQVIPPSCYADLQQTVNAMFIKGCVNEMQNHYDNGKFAIIVASWVLAAFELGCFAVAVFLGISFRNKQRRMQF